MGLDHRDMRGPSGPSIKRHKAEETGRDPPESNGILHETVLLVIARSFAQGPSEPAQNHREAPSASKQKRPRRTTIATATVTCLALLTGFIGYKTAEINLRASALTSQAAKLQLQAIHAQHKNDEQTARLELSRHRLELEKARLEHATARLELARAQAR